MGCRGLRAPGGASQQPLHPSSPCARLLPSAPEAGQAPRGPYLWLLRNRVDAPMNQRGEKDKTPPSTHVHTCSSVYPQQCLPLSTPYPYLSLFLCLCLSLFPWKSPVALEIGACGVKSRFPMGFMWITIKNWISAMLKQFHHKGLCKGWGD